LDALTAIANMVAKKTLTIEQGRQEAKENGVSEQEFYAFLHENFPNIAFPS